MSVALKMSGGRRHSRRPPFFIFFLCLDRRRSRPDEVKLLPVKQFPRHLLAPLDADRGRKRHRDVDEEPHVLSLGPVDGRGGVSRQTDK